MNLKKVVKSFLGKVQKPEKRKFLNEILVGEDYQIGDYTYGLPIIKSWEENKGTKLKIGKFCSIYRDAEILLGGNHRSDWVSTYPFEILEPVFGKINGLTFDSGSKGDVVIGNDVWVCSRAMILSGVKIGDGAVIGAGAIVASDVPPYAVVVGNPARVVKYRFDEETIQYLLKLKWWDWSIKRICNQARFLGSSNVNTFIKITSGGNV